MRSLAVLLLFFAGACATRIDPSHRLLSAATASLDSALVQLALETIAGDDHIRLDPRPLAPEAEGPLGLPRVLEHHALAGQRQRYPYVRQIGTSDILRHRECMGMSGLAPPGGRREFPPHCDEMRAFATAALGVPEPQGEDGAVVRMRADVVGGAGRVVYEILFGRDGDGRWQVLEKREVGGAIS